ncbi:uncharacterized protein TM35_000342370 [Trypanosoma theileri]|uniref:Paraflagellar rod component n=1 Tax=Trypanosoma theileri TaxID=67003 RepID=A0A1X0NLN9_9TRYP|nr:uncharacterized protein TM35_000342370 [Trypanosoma theileri]ORC85625.1 hypothetical protein TM35_000342370 [Trypanosoma theileri]
MQLVSASMGPLSPFLWDSPHAKLVPPGFTPGTVADAMLHISDLTLRFDVLAKAIDYSVHPVRRAMETHALHTRMLHKRQFDVMRYGMVLDEVERLVLVPMPRLCGDTGMKVSQEYAAIFGGDFNESPSAWHPILPEYCFIVYQLPKECDSKDSFPVPIFRLVFRNEAFNENIKMHLVEKFPLFRLRSVYVSQSKYYSFQHQLELYAKASSSSEHLPDRALEGTLGLSPLRWIFDAWLLVLEGIAPSWVIDKGVGPDIVTLFLASHRAEGKYDVKETLEVYSEYPVDNRVRCSYYTSGDRMRKRIQVMRRYPDMINKWRQGSYDVRYFSEEVTTSEPSVDVAQCIRILLCRRKPGNNYIEDDEIAAFIPDDKESEPLQVYNTLAAERLRLWVLKGLLTAELHGVHSLILEFDTTMVVAKCVGLLWGGGEESRQREVVFHVCKIIVETVEDFVQHSGIIWQATIVASGEDSHKAVELCRDILEITQMAKTRVEIEERRRVAAAATMTADKEGPATPSDSGVTVPEGEEEDVTKETLEGKKKGISEKKGALTVQTTTTLPTGPLVVNVGGGNTVQIPPFTATAHLSENIREGAALCGVRILDAELYPIFLALSGGGETVPIRDVVQLILEKQLETTEGCCSRPSSNTRLLWPHDHPICPMDNCGVPYDENTLTDFVKSFQRRPYRAQERDFRATIQGTVGDVPESLNYVEFSMMMLAIARQ